MLEMTMRRIMPGVIALLALALPAAAESVAETVARQLREQGYQRVETSYTWLGRLRVNAMQGDMRREIVINPNTGEILRDYETLVPLIAEGGKTSGSPVSLGSATVTRSESDGDKVVDLVEPGTTVGDDSDLGDDTGVSDGPSLDAAGE